MKTNRYGIQPDWKPDPQVEELKAIVDYSRKNPDRLRWQNYLNEWQVTFVINLLGVEEHTNCFTPTANQKKKIVECLDKLTAGIVQYSGSESANSSSIQDSADVASMQLELIKEFVRITTSKTYIQTDAVARRLSNVLIEELSREKKLAYMAGEDFPMLEAHSG